MPNQSEGSQQNPAWYTQLSAYIQQTPLKKNITSFSWVSGLIAQISLWYSNQGRSWVCSGRKVTPEMLDFTMSRLESLLPPTLKASLTSFVEETKKTNKPHDLASKLLDSCYEALETKYRQELPPLSPIS